MEKVKVVICGCTKNSSNYVRNEINSILNLKPLFLSLDIVIYENDSTDNTVNILKSMEKRGLIERKPNPLDGRGVIIHLTEFGREKRQYSKEKVLKFNEDIRNHVSEEKLKHFYEVADLINERVSNKKIYNQNEIKSS